MVPEGAEISMGRGLQLFTANLPLFGPDTVLKEGQKPLIYCCFPPIRCRKKAATLPPVPAALA